MTARRTVTVPAWIELTMVVREQQTDASYSYGDGEDDGDVTMIRPPQTVEVTVKAKAKREFIRYFFKRRDAQAGSELHFTNGHIWIVQEPLDHLKTVLPGFVEVHSSGAPSEIMVHPDNVRFFHGLVPPLGSSTIPAGSVLTFPNGHKLAVTEGYDDLNAKFGLN